MRTRYLQLAIVLTLSSFALAQKQQQKHGATAAPETTNCAVTFTSGSGHNKTQFCVTANGNITQFSRDTDEYIQAGGVEEGYGLCDLNSNTSYFDYAEADSGNWSPATFSSTGTQAITTRLTGDGIWKITNTVTNIPATSSAPGSAKVTMKVQNLSSTNRTLILLRFADVDFSRDGTEDFDNDFDFTADTASGLEPGGGTGLSLVNGSFTFEHLAFTQKIAEGPDPCNVTKKISKQPFFGDGSVVQAYGLPMPKLAIKTVSVTYKPF